MTVTHLLVDLWPRDRDVLKRVEPVRSLLLAGTRAAGARILHQRFHQFTPSGFTGFVLIAESHVSVHSWVDEGWMALDVFSCGGLDAGLVVRHLQEGLDLDRVHERRVPRGP